MSRLQKMYGEQYSCHTMEQGIRDTAWMLRENDEMHRVRKLLRERNGMAGRRKAESSSPYYKVITPLKYFAQHFLEIRVCSDSHSLRLFGSIPMW